MKLNRIRGRWTELRGAVRESWGRLTGNDLDVRAGQRDQLIGILQQRDGSAKEEAERRIDSIIRRTLVAR